MNLPAPHPVAKRFIDLIANAGFPCVGAKAAKAQGTIAFYVADTIYTDAYDQKAARKLQAFAQCLAPEKLYYSFVLLFPGSGIMDEAAFEKYLWRRLAGMHAHDRHEWDPQVSSDPASPEFSMSIGGRAFYIIGLHPGASRPARRFECPALVFNAHEQFERLRAEGLYDKMKSTIIDRDIRANGSANPMLAVHGEQSEARQYSGRVVGAAWQCPFHPMRKKIDRVERH